MIPVRNIQQIDRIQRALTQSFYLLDYSFNGNDMCYFNISGSTTNVYKVVLTNIRIQCNCPDMVRCLSMNCICKHCWFVLLKVLKVYEFYHSGILFNRVSQIPIDYTNTFLFNRVSQIPTDYANTLIFNDIDRDYIQHCYMNLGRHIDPTVCNDNLKQMYYRIKEQGPKPSIFEDKPKDIDDNCPICMVPFNKKENLINCPTCKKYLHKECIDSWLKVRKNCPMCRSGIFQNYGQNIQSEYINLSI